MDNQLSNVMVEKCEMMTIRQVAETLGVNERTIRRAIKELRETDSTVRFDNVGSGKPNLLNETQVTAISLIVKQAHNSGLALSGNKDAITTRQERLLVVQQAMTILMEENQILEQEKQALSLELKDEKAKTSLLEKSDDNLEVREAAKLLKMKPTELFTWLEKNKWFYRPKSNSKHKVAYQAKINRGYLEQCTTFINDAFEVSFIKITPKGLSYLAGKFTKEVKE